MANAIRVGLVLSLSRVALKLGFAAIQLWIAGFFLVYLVCKERCSPNIAINVLVTIVNIQKNLHRIRLSNLELNHK